MRYLKTSMDTLLPQIAQRGRDFEKEIEQPCLEQLNSLYNDGIARYKHRLLIIDSDHPDFVNK